MASAQSSQDICHGRGRRPLISGNAQPRHRSESRRLSDRRRQVETVARKRDHCPDALREGDTVQVFSRSADQWVDGEAVKFVEEHSVRVEYKVGVDWYGKVMHIDSENLFIPTAIADSSEELEFHHSDWDHLSDPGPLAFESSEELEEHDPGMAFDEDEQVEAWSRPKYNCKGEAKGLNAHIILTDGHGNIFLIKNKSGKWSYPGGRADRSDKREGSLDPFDTMKREFQEEVGVELPQLRPGGGKLSGREGSKTVIFVAHANLDKDLLPHLPKNGPKNGTLNGDGENTHWKIVPVHSLLSGTWNLRGGTFSAVEEANSQNFFQ